MRPDRLPRLGRLASLRFAWDPPGMLTAGRALAVKYHYDVGPFHGPWTFRLAGAPVVVVSDAGALHLPARVYRPGLLAPLLGEHSRYLVDRPPLDGPYRRAGSVREQIAEELTAALDWATGHVDDRPVDVVPILRKAAIRVCLRQLNLGPRQFWRAEAAAWVLLDAADTPALVVPALRALGHLSGWSRLAPARERFLREVFLDEDVGDAVVTSLVGWADGPVLLAARALAEAGETVAGRPDEELALHEALRHPTVPLALREAVGPLELPGGVELRPGEAFAVDLQAADRPFGAGAHACPRRDPGVAFAEEALRLVEASGLRADPATLRLGRSRLSWGPTSLRVRPFSYLAP